MGIELTELEPLVRRALAEDVGSGDLTTRATTEMPAWESNPEVVLGVKSLYAYVRAQAE